MHVAWFYCQAGEFVAERKTNQLEQFKKKSLLVHKETKIKINEMLCFIVCNLPAQKC